eukprot:403362353
MSKNNLKGSPMPKTAQEGHFAWQQRIQKESTGKLVSLQRGLNIGLVNSIPLKDIESDLQQTADQIMEQKIQKVGQLSKMICTLSNLNPDSLHHFKANQKLFMI